MAINENENQTDQTPQASVPMPPQHLPKTARTKKWLWALIAGVICVAGAGYAYLYLTTLVFVTVPDISELQPVYGVDDATKFESPRALVDTASADLGGIVSVATVNNYVGLDNQGVAVYKLPYYATAGSSFKNLPYKGAGTAFKSDVSQSEVNYTKLESFFIQNNFRPLVLAGEDTSYIAEGIEVPFTNYAVYESGEMVCSIWRADVSSISTPGTNLVSVGCADKTNYVDAASDILPLYTSYAKSDGKHEALRFALPNIADSNSGYKRADVYQEDYGLDTKTKSFIGLYYLSPGSSEWKYFGKHGTKPDQLPACDIFNTAELKTAFAGYTCYDKTLKKNALVK